MSVRAIALAFLFALFNVASARAADDVGRVILSFGAKSEPIMASFALHFRTKDGKHRDWTTYIEHNWIYSTKNDFDTDQERGAVKILKLAPGDWELYDLDADFGYVHFSAKTEFSIPFTVKPGQTVYLGDFTAIELLRQGGGNRSAAGIFVLVSDQSTRDVAIAKSEDKEISDVAIEIPDVNAMHNPLFVAPRKPSSPSSQPI
jgi:voltage-gated potassium channel Kch